MTKPIELRPEAVAEMRQAFGWYEEKQRGLGLQFLFVDGPDRITVIAIYHGRRKPYGWSGRVSEPEVVAFGSAAGGVVRRSGAP